MAVDFSNRPPAQIPFPNLLDLYDLALETPPGNFAEVGVYQGGSAWVINLALNPNFKFYLYDTFEGIPYMEKGDCIPVGMFKDTSEDLVRKLMPEAKIKKGLFPDTFSEHALGFSFVHIDCDVHRACKKALDLFWPRLNPGGIIAFDDYPFEGIKKAIHDFTAIAPLSFTNKTKIPYFKKEI